MLSDSQQGSFDESLQDILEGSLIRIFRNRGIFWKIPGGILGGFSAQFAWWIPIRFFFGILAGIHEGIAVGIKKSSQEILKTCSGMVLEDSSWKKWRKHWIVSDGSLVWVPIFSLPCCGNQATTGIPVIKEKSYCAFLNEKFRKFWRNPRRFFLYFLQDFWRNPTWNFWRNPRRKSWRNASCNLF